MVQKISSFVYELSEFMSFVYELSEFMSFVYELSEFMYFIHEIWLSGQQLYLIDLPWENC